MQGLQAFKHVLDLSCSCLVVTNGSKNVRNMIQAGFRWLFSREILKFAVAGGVWRLCSLTPVREMLKLRQLFPQTSKLRHFLNKRILTLDSPSTLGKFWLLIWSHNMRYGRKKTGHYFWATTSNTVPPLLLALIV